MTGRLSLTVIIPARNEEETLAATLAALLRQTEPADEVIVVDDCSADRTGEMAAGYGVTVLRPPDAQGSKARAQNYALPHCTTDLVLPVDADTVLDANYIELIKQPFEDPRVVVAAGCVQTRFDRTATERGRSIEYLYGFHWHRPIQNVANSPMVCSGCCSAFHRETLVTFGGFPERTIVEDMDYTWSQQILGRRAVYVGEAVARAADPETVRYFRRQVWRWMAGFFQNVRIHLVELLKRKPVLALWVSLAVWEILTAPLWYATPFILTIGLDMPVAPTLVLWFGIEIALLAPPLIYAARRRQLSLLRIVGNIPYLYLVKAINFGYAWKAFIVEILLVPLGLSRGLLVYEKGRADRVGTGPPAVTRGDPPRL